MTNITGILNGIRYVAESGREIAQDNQESDDGWDDPYQELRVNFESILHNVNRMEAAMTTDTTDEAQWWWVVHDDDGWRVRGAVDQPKTYVAAIRACGKWGHKARVHCTRAAAEQAAVDAWAEAGFAHAPKEPPGPKIVEVTWWANIRKDRPLEDVQNASFFSERDIAELRRKSAWGERDTLRIVRVDATVSEVTE